MCQSHGWVRYTSRISASPPRRYAQLLRTQIVDSVTFLHQDVSLGSKVHRDEPRADGNGGVKPSASTVFTKICSSTAGACRRCQRCTSWYWLWYLACILNTWMSHLLSHHFLQPALEPAMMPCHSLAWNPPFFEAPPATGPSVPIPCWGPPGWRHGAAEPHPASGWAKSDPLLCRCVEGGGTKPKPGEGWGGHFSKSWVNWLWRMVRNATFVDYII